MPPMTRGMAHKGVRHYAPYNLCSRGPNQTLLDLSSPPSTLRTPVRLHNAVGARGVVPAPHVHAAEGNPLASANDFIYPDIGKAIRDGVPPVTVGFAVKTRFIQDCLELVKVVEEEQKKILRALEANEIISQERLEMFGRHAIDYVDKCAGIAMEALANEIEKHGADPQDLTCRSSPLLLLWIMEVLDDKVLEWLECASQMSSPPGVGSQDGADDCGPVIQDYISSRPGFDGGTLASFSTTVLIAGHVCPVWGMNSIAPSMNGSGANASDLLGQDVAKPSLRLENESSLTLCFTMNLVYSERDLEWTYNLSRNRTCLRYRKQRIDLQCSRRFHAFLEDGWIQKWHLESSVELVLDGGSLAKNMPALCRTIDILKSETTEVCGDSWVSLLLHEVRLQHRKLGYDSLKEDAIEIGGYYVLVGSISTWLTMPKGRSMPYNSQKGYPYTPALRRQDLNLADSQVHTHNSAAKIIPTEGQLQHKCSPNVNTVSIIKVPWVRMRSTLFGRSLDASASLKGCITIAQCRRSSQYRQGRRPHQLKQLEVAPKTFCVTSITLVLIAESLGIVTTLLLA
ncbi:hypothetical protein EDC04DRAFT_2603377 [Pisolithus marmoratus]|nr:hypothetical protein EDC04DRAFT_2603377 [Pisolithus marmoratus]